MNIEKALQIPGWMTERELAWLADQAGRGKLIAEIGCWRGRSSRALADNTTGILFSVDTWDDRAVGIDGWWSTPEDRAKRKNRNWLWNEFRGNLADHIEKNRVFPHRAKSLEAARYFAYNEIKFDMIFIDADHTLKAVKKDIQEWGALLKEGGLLCGHDYDEKMWPEVAPTVNSLVKLAGVVDTIWYAEKGIR